MKSSNKIAFFDIDNTLVDGSTGIFVLLQFLSENLISNREIIKILHYYLQHKCNKLDYENAIKWVYSICGRVSISDLFRIIDIAYDKYILHRIFQDGIDTIKKYKENGYLVCIATASDYYIAKKIMLQVSADFLISNNAVVKNNRLTSNIFKPICYGLGKKRLAMNFAQENGISLSKCTFYSDSITDLPLLTAVGHPFIVNNKIYSCWYKKIKNYNTVQWKKSHNFFHNVLRRVV